MTKEAWKDLALMWFVIITWLYFIGKFEGWI